MLNLKKSIKSGHGNNEEFLLCMAAERQQAAVRII